MKEDIELPDQPDGPDQPDNTQRIVEVPWYWDELQLKRKIKIAGKILLFIGSVWILYHFCGIWAFLGLVPIPFWYVYLLRQLDRDSYTLIEVRLEGDQIGQDALSKDTQLNMYYVPPEIWKELKKEGTPFTPGERVYICDKYDEDKKIIYFPRDKRFTNLNFWTRLELWMELKDRVPILETKLAKYMYNSEQKAREYAFEMLMDMQIFNRSKSDLEEVVRPRISSRKVKSHGNQ